MPTMEIILATRNPSKAQQIKAIFSDSSIEILTLDQAGIEGAAVEDGTTLEQNALRKARYAHDRASTPAWTMSDDTGIFIDALNGEPGVQTAYWGGEGLSAEARMNYCLKRLEGIEDRRAIFRTCVVMISPEGDEQLFYGEAKGHVLKAPQGTTQPSMPYSAIFVPDGETHSPEKTVGAQKGRSWAQMTVEEENELSHRGKAFRQARSFLESLTPM
jgi:XTP/dITP diphosphohydrolase